MPLAFARVLTLVLAVIAATAAEPVAAPTFSEQVDASLVKFEKSIAKEVLPIQRLLDKWRNDRRRAALNEVAALLKKTEGGDKVYLAWAVLGANPKHKAAREVFTKLGVAVPIDAKGQPVAGAKVPACSDRALIDKVANLAAPPFDAVARQVDDDTPGVKPYVKRQKAALDQLKDELLTLARSAGDPQSVASLHTMLAFYHPRAPEVAQYWQSQSKPIPRNRTWFNPIDRYLLDHGLAGIDCLRSKSQEGRSFGGDGTKAVSLAGQASWRFLEYLGNCRVEAVISAQGGQRPSFMIADDDGHGASVTVDGRKLVVGHAGGDSSPLAEFHLEQDFAAVPLPLALEVRGRSVRVAVSGLTVGSCELPKAYAYIQVRVDGAGAQAQQLRLRFLADLPEAPLDEDPAVAAKEPEPAPSEPWRDERGRQLEQTVTFVFADQSFDEVAAVLSQVSGVPFTLDAKAEALKDLPVSLNGSDIRLQTALEWLTRLTDIEFVQTDAGITCTWNG
ncbi:MAG TPA: hypothetical protein VEL07_10985 [Planctomycetota bacterium]|nr:hypothetical protein [Planctomycetota bacterium]